MSTNFDKFAILDSFVDEVASYLPEIEANLDRLQQQPTNQEAIEETYRRAHTIGGSAAMMDFSALAQVAQGMEAILGNALDGASRLDGPTIALLRRSFGRLSRLLEMARTGADGSQLLAEDDADHAASRGGAAPSEASEQGGMSPGVYANGSASSTGPVPGAGADYAPGAAGQAGGQVPGWLSAFGPANGSHGGSAPLPAQPAQPAPGYPGAGPVGGPPSVDEMVQAFRANPTGPVPTAPGGYPPQGMPGPQAPQFGGAGYPPPAMPPAQQTKAAKSDPFASSGIFDLPPELDMDASAEPDTARSLIAISPAWEVLANSEDALQQQVRFLRDIIGALREAAQAMDEERAELRTFLDGSKDAIDRLEDWAGQAMGLDLRRSPEQVRRYLPLSVVWVTTTRLKKLVSLLNGSGRRLNTFQNDLSDALRSLHVSINNVGRLYSSVAAVASSTHHNGDGGFTATVAQLTQVQFKPGPSAADEPTGPMAAVAPAAEPASLPPGARAEMERQVRDELRQELEDEVRGEIAAQVRDEETTRLRHQIEIEVRRQVLAELSPGLGSSAAPPASFVVSQPTAATPALPPSIPLAPRAPQPVRVSEQSAETLEVFREEADEHLRNIALGIRELEADPSNKSALQAVRRATHTLKGAAGMMDFKAIEHLAHASEDLLDQMMDGGISLTADVQGLLLDTSEALEQLVTGANASGNGAGQLMTSLQQRYDRLLGSTAPRLATSGPLPPSTVVGMAPSVSSLAGASAEGGEGQDAGAESDLTVRLRLSKLDEIINLFGDLLQSRSILEERITRMSGMVGDATRASERLQEIGSQLETRFEAATLPSGPGGPSALPPAAPTTLNRALGGVQPPGGPSAMAHLGEFHELELDRYTEFHRLSRGLSEGVTDMVTLSNEMESLLREVEGVFARESRLSSAFQDRLLKARLVPLQLMIPRLYRSTRAAAIKQGKDVEFLVQGGDTEVDRTVYEEVAGPLLHIVRNAVAHGIERPEARQRQGKPAAGKIVLTATEQGNQVIITVQDDGAGIDTTRVSSLAIARGLVPPTTVLTPQQAQNLIFQPGFSTSESIDEESGRGVGLDVVKDAITRMRGTVEVSSEQGRGTRFTLRIPVSLQITRAVIVRLGAQTFAIPMNVIEQIGRLDYYERVSDRNGPAVEVRGAVYPLAHLASYLGLPPSRTEERSSLLLYNSGQRRMALLIDAIPNRQEIVVKSLGPHLRDVRGVSGATIGGDGKVVLLLNMDDLLAHPPIGGVTAPELPLPNASIPRMPVAAPPADGTAPLPDMESLAKLNTAAMRHTAPPAPSPAPRAMRPSMPIGPRRTAPPARSSYVLVVDDSPSVRRVVSNTLKANGWEVQTARDGVEAVEIIGQRTPAAVLLDIEMPRMDGYELMATLRSQPQYQHLPLVVLTSRAATKHQQRALQLGANAYVVKPYQDDELLGTLDNLIAQQSTR